MFYVIFACMCVWHINKDYFFTYLLTLIINVVAKGRFTHRGLCYVCLCCNCYHLRWIKMYIWYCTNCCDVLRNRYGYAYTEAAQRPGFAYTVLSYWNTSYTVLCRSFIWLYGSGKVRHSSIDRRTFSQAIVAPPVGYTVNYTAIAVLCMLML